MLTEHFTAHPRRVVEAAAPKMDPQDYQTILGILRETPFEYLAPPQADRLNRTTGGASFTLGATLGPAGCNGFNQNLCLRNGRYWGVSPKVVKDRCRNPELRRSLLILWGTLIKVAAQADPEFSFSSATVIRDFAGAPHTDRNNTTHQLAMSFGDFSGGRLVAETADPAAIASFDTHGRPTRVDGRRPHWVSPYEGTRFSVILYTVLGEQTGLLSNLPS